VFSAGTTIQIIPQARHLPEAHSVHQRHPWLSDNAPGGGLDISAHLVYNRIDTGRVQMD